MAVATDISEAAIETASLNASMHQVDGRLTVIKGDTFDGVNDSFDLIASNPPYIPDAQIPGLQPEVRDFEPVTALSGGQSGLDIVERIVSDAPPHLKPGGSLLIEIGFEQSENVRELFDVHIWHPPVFLPDLAGIPRVVKAKLR